MIIAATVQLTEMFIKKTSPALFREPGRVPAADHHQLRRLAVPLFQTARGYSFVQCVVFAVGASGGYWLALGLLSLVRERT